MGHSKSSSEREIYSNTVLSQERRKMQTNNLTLYLKHLEKEEQTKPRISRRKEIIKNRAEINNIETKKTIAKINVAKVGSLKRSTKLYKPLARFIKKKKRKRVQIN